MADPAAIWDPSSLSVVVPVHDEVESIGALLDEIFAALGDLGLPFELIIVDDGSRDGTGELLIRHASSRPELVVVRLRRNFGQTLALRAGFERARGDAVVTLDGDLQNDPRDIPRLLDQLRCGADVVSGWRRQRRDPWMRRLPSWLANRLIARSTGLSLHDHGCGLKAYRRSVVRSLHLYGDLHRFVALLAVPLGARIVEIEVNHRPRIAGRSKYGLSRTYKVLADLVTMQLLLRFRENPARGFALMGAPFFALAAASVGVGLLGSGPLAIPAAVAVFASSSGLACLLSGLLAELVLAHARREPPSLRPPRVWEKDT